MKILFVNEKCGYFGGVEQNIADTVVGLTERGHKCELAFGHRTDRGADQYAGLFARVHSCPLHGMQRDDDSRRQARTRIESILHDSAPDVVYLHKLGSIGCFLPSQTGVRAVRMVHDHDVCCPRRHKYFFHNGRTCSYPAGWRCYLDLAFIERRAGKRLGIGWASIRQKIREMRQNYALDKILVGSRAMRDELRCNGFPAEKLEILPPVIRLPDRDYSPAPDTRSLLYIGQLIRGKGVDLLLEALRGVRCDFQAVIAGVGNAQRELESSVRRFGFSDRVVFHGWVDRRTLEEFYRAAKILVVPSRWPEPFGMIGLEAMSHGRAVVGFASGGITDWLEHEVTGLLVPEQDTRLLGEAIQRLLLDTELARRLGRGGLDRLKERFSFDSYLDWLETHLKG